MNTPAYLDQAIHDALAATHAAEWDQARKQLRLAMHLCDAMELLVDPDLPTQGLTPGVPDPSEHTGSQEVPTVLPGQVETPGVIPPMGPR